MASFFIPLTGLESDSTALNTIANDLANMNTTAFKSQSVNFSDLFYQQIGSAGSGDPIQVGAGVQVASIETAFGQGSINSTGNATDVALNGNGFFVVNNGGINEYSRAGNFSLNSNGNLVTQNGLSVMGYPAVNGVVNTNSPLSAINIPVGQVEPPQATSSFGMTANLDSAAPIGTSFPAQTTVYDSLGVSYLATVTYTKTGTNTWSYNITVPDTLQANPSTQTTVTYAVTPTNPNGTTIDYGFTSSQGTLSTVAPSTTLTITGPTAVLGVNATIIPPVVTAGETVAAYAAALQTAVTTAGITGVTVSSAGGQLSIVGAGVTTAGVVNQTMAASSTNYNFGSSGGTSTTVDPGTNLTITGLTAAGTTATITAPPVTANETVAAYAAALQAQVAAAGIMGVNVSSVGGTLNITGANESTSGNIIQDAVPSANASGTMIFNSSGNLTSPAANVSGITFGGFTDGAANLNMTWDLLGASGTPTISQVDAASAVSAANAKRLRQRRVSELHHLRQRHRVGYLLQRAAVGGGTTGAGQRGQRPGIADAGQRRLCDHPGQWHGFGQHLRSQRAGYAAGRGIGGVQRQHLRRVLRPDHRPAGLRGQLQGGNHLRYGDPGNHQHDSLGWRIDPDVSAVTEK